MSEELTIQPQITQPQTQPNGPTPKDYIFGVNANTPKLSEAEIINRAASAGAAAVETLTPPGPPPRFSPAPESLRQLITNVVAIQVGEVNKLTNKSLDEQDREIERLGAAVANLKSLGAVVETLKTQAESNKSAVELLTTAVRTLATRVTELERSAGSTPAPAHSKKNREADLPADKWITSDDYLAIAGKGKLGGSIDRKNALCFITGYYRYNMIEPPEVGLYRVKELRSYASYVEACKASGEFPNSRGWMVHWTAAEKS